MGRCLWLLIVSSMNGRRAIGADYPRKAARKLREVPSICLWAARTHLLFVLRNA